MNLYKKITGLIAVFLLFIVASNAYAQETLPHFFPAGVKPTNVPAKQWQEWLLYQNAARNALANPNGNWPGFISGGSITLEKEYFGQKTKLVFDNYFQEGERIRYTNFDGQYYITKAQFEVVVDFMDRSVRRAVEYKYAFWAPAIKLVRSEAAKSFNVPEKEFEDFLKRKTPMNPNLTFRELLLVPEELEEKDFVPFREIHLGLTPDYPSVLGVTWLNIGIVYYTPVAMIRDYLLPYPVVQGHEFVHANQKLQSMPWVWGFDADVMASIPAMLVENDHLSLPFHSYAREFREFAWVYFRFDFDQARRETVKFEEGLMGNLLIDEEAFNRNATKLEEIKKEFLSFFPRVIAEFYSKMIFYMALNDKLLDDNAAFKLMMAANYDPTLLGGREETVKWLEAHRQKIKEMADKAWEDSGKTEDGGEMTMLAKEERIPLLLLGGIKAIYDISDADIQRFIAFHKATPREIFRWGPEKLKKAIEDFIRQKRFTKEVQ